MARSNVIERHRNKVAWVVFIGLCLTFPAYLFSNFDKLVKDKTFLEWLSENGWGWKAVLKFTLVWLVASAVLSLIVYGILTLISRFIKDKSQKPKLCGKIICLEVNSTPTFKFEDQKNDCFLTFQLKVTNEALPTMVSRWQLDLLWKGIEYPSIKGSVEGYCVERHYPQARGRETRIEPRRETLTEFPNNEEITNTNYKIGWLRFSVGSFPSEALLNDSHLSQEVILKLQAFDSKDHPHLIYEGVQKSLARCGTIQRRDPLPDKRAISESGDISFELTGLNSDRYDDGAIYMLPRFKYKTGVGHSPKIEVKANLTVWDDDALRLDEYPGVWHGAKIRSKRFGSGDSAELVLGLVSDKGMVGCEYNVSKTANGTKLDPKLTELNGKQFYVLVVFIARTDEDVVFEKRQWFGVIAGPEPRFIGLLKPPSHIW